MLSDLKIKAVKPQEKPFRLSDGRGLYLLVHPNGSKYWQVRYRWRGKENILSLGVYPLVSLLDARKKCIEVKHQLINQKKPLATTDKNVFADVFRQWLLKQNSSDSYKLGVSQRLEKYALPIIGKMPLQSIEPADILTIIKPIEAAGKHETAQRVRARVSQIFRWAIANDWCRFDPAHAVRDVLMPKKVVNRPAITDPKRLATLLKSISGYHGGIIVGAALRLAPLLFVRPGELRQMEWREIDIEAALWRIPAKKMKMNSEHLVPLPRQALEVLRELRPYTAQSRYVFPTPRNSKRPLSNNAMRVALMSLGWMGDEMTVHGFRSTASTLLNEQGWPPDIIEKQLAHIERNKVRAAYNRAEYLDKRREMMQAWADYLDHLKRH